MPIFFVDIEQRVSCTACLIHIYSANTGFSNLTTFWEMSTVLIEQNRFRSMSLRFNQDSKSCISYILLQFIFNKFNISILISKAWCSHFKNFKPSLRYLHNKHFVRPICSGARLIRYKCCILIFFMILLPFRSQV